MMSKSDEQRATRLAEALRQNLRRRKTQARATETRSGTEQGAAGIPLDEKRDLRSEEEL